MSRLIDADELLKHKTDHEYISTHLIYNAPTVDAIPTQAVRDAIAEIEEQRKSIHISAFVGCRLKGEYDDLYLNGKHSGLLLALEIIHKHTGIGEE